LAIWFLGAYCSVRRPRQYRLSGERIDGDTSALLWVRRWTGWCDGNLSATVRRVAELTWLGRNSR
jgi:hypothetical protein